MKLYRNYLVVVCLFFCFSGQSPAEPQVVQVSADASLQFLMHLLEKMDAEIPEFNQENAVFRKGMEATLAEARRLLAATRRPEMKGRYHVSDQETVRKKGRELLEQALLDCENHLTKVLQHLKEHREQLIDSLMPKEK